MKKLITLIAVLMATISAVANPNSKMTFAGKANFYVVQGGTEMGSTVVESDTIIYSGNDFTLPSMKYGEMVIPSFTIAGTANSGSYAGVTWEDQTWSATAIAGDGSEKTITGSSLVGSFTHTDGVYNLKLSITFNYGNMPMPITYSIDSYYVKQATDKVSVMVGDKFGPYTNDQVLYDSRIYVEDDVKKLDVTMHQYSLAGTVMGEITLGKYCVKGLVYDNERGGYYRDYANDGITFHFKSSQGMDGDYAFSKGTLLVKMNGTSIAYAENTFQPGAMPFPIIAAFGDESSTGIAGAITEENSRPKTLKYFKNGQLIIERDGKKYSINGYTVE